MFDFALQLNHDNFNISTALKTSYGVHFTSQKKKLIFSKFLANRMNARTVVWVKSSPATLNLSKWDNFLAKATIPF